MRFFIAVNEGISDQLNALAAIESEHERDWWDRRVEAFTRPPGSPPGTRRAAMRELRAERARLRADGTLLGSRDRLVAHFADLLLRQEGWRRDWPAPPPGALTTRGRRWGVVIDQPFPERLSLDLPAELGECVRRAAHWLSAEPTAALIEWYGRFGDGPAARTPDEKSRSRFLKPNRADLDARDNWRSQVITTGRILRSAVDLTLDQAQDRARSRAGLP
jgi:hypothetical protein